MDFNQIVEAYNILKKSIHSTIKNKKHFEKLPQLKEYIQKYEYMIDNAIEKAEDYKKKYEDLLKDPLIAHIVNQRKKIEDLEYKITDLEEDIKRHKEREH